jgi:hypothetical protein
MLSAVFAVLLFPGCQEKSQDIIAEQEKQQNIIENVNEEPIDAAQMPILAWYSVPIADAKPDAFQELKECGFTISLTVVYLAVQLEGAIRILDAAEKSGVKVMFMCQEAMLEDPEGVVDRIKNHPALYGYCVRDEPTISDIPDLAKVVERIRAVDPNHPVYINLLPGSGENYDNYVNTFVDTIHPTFLSFDNHAVHRDYISSDWWYNIETIRSAANKAGIPFWAFACSLESDSRPTTTIGILRLYNYTNLAYGAQCMQYFTYWRPNGPTFTSATAPIVRGERTPIYDLVKEMNEEIQARAGVFVGCSVLQVAHTGESIPEETTRLTSLPAPLTALDTKGNGAMVSLIENGKWRYLVVVNRNYDGGFDYDIAFDREVAIVERDGSITLFGGDQRTMHLGEGDCAIYRWAK